MEAKFDIPVLMVTFNRPAYAQQVFDKIKRLKPKQLFIFSDAPRAGKAGEAEKVAECRALFDDANFTWDCEVHKHFATANMGCGPGVKTAITWAFESVEKLIILEDDCVPDLSFFDYCETMLAKYENDPKVMHVAGTRWNEEFDAGKGDHFFCTVGHVWGWATWKRAWKLYDYRMSTWVKKHDRKMVRDIYHDRILYQFWVDCFVDTFKNIASTNHTWDYQWQYTLFKNKGLSTVPKENLITNIGELGAHTKVDDTDVSSFNRKTGTWAEDESIAVKVEPNIAYEKYHIRNFFLRDTTFKQRLKFFIKSFI
ncbi:hypothetical protein KXQ82_10540 [Mucilaginibacter sp. HMF5004]|uniref:hypothetical protein n=1 Tax=Mucilaginibacter rivuli TaxID=2857527 RepID=UPI001C5EEBE2|nr:hypothetical protein [Mucilaginibacter rivuli]MBW4890157.1 hypothetical protein [Mucilaginibacter rivuli]